MSLNPIDLLTERLRAARRVTVMTGAGVSAASGIPTFRGPGGLWRQFRPEDLATPDAFERDPRLVWEWYDWRRQQIAAARPNRTHEVLAAWSRRHAGWTVVTQNVDGLLERAGARRVVRLHGSIWDLTCWDHCAGSPGVWRDETVPLAVLPPACPNCGGVARPGVVWFGEPLAPGDLDAASRAARCEVFITAGTSALVFPAAQFLHEAAASGAFTVEINPDVTAASDVVDLRVREPAELAFDLLEQALTHGG
jgi:NAD-dependent deacetylase